MEMKFCLLVKMKLHLWEEPTQGKCKQKLMSDAHNVWNYKEAKFFTKTDTFDCLFPLFLQNPNCSS